jgi:cysteine/glycine-rich protein
MAQAAPKCEKCQKTVYPMERQDYDGIAYHKTCFKCLKCQKTIGVGAVAKIQGDIYCRPCFKHIFAEKGNYASFGEKTLAKNAPMKDKIAAGVADSGDSSAGVADATQSIDNLKLGTDQVKETASTNSPSNSSASPVASPTANGSSSSSPSSYTGTSNTQRKASLLGGSAPSVTTPGSDKCERCQKTVYPMEMQKYDDISYHKNCFKCLKCQKTMGVGAVAKIQGDLYCKPCFKHIFTEKGNYASFGEKTLAKNAPIKDRIAAGTFEQDGSSASSSSSSSVATATKDEEVKETPIAAVQESENVDTSSNVDQGQVASVEDNTIDASGSTAAEDVDVPQVPGGPN